MLRRKQMLGKLLEFSVRGDLKERSIGEWWYLTIVMQWTMEI